MGKKTSKKRQNGLTSDKTQGLRRAMRDAAANEDIGPTAVANALGFETLDDALTSITVDMPKSEFGAAANALKKLTKPKGGNKYAQYSKAGERAAVMSL